MDFSKKAKAIIRTELTKRDIDYPELSSMLEKIGVHEKRENLSNKSFSFYSTFCFLKIFFQ